MPVFTTTGGLDGPPNARLTFHGRCLLVRRVVQGLRPVAHVARELGVSRQCAHRWVARFRAEGWTGLHVPPVRPRDHARTCRSGRERACVVSCMTTN
ncbi:leucine zipper domain-containing protein [Streptomyces sp. NPDC006510]|uniref:leucine zipper domain-containing protein n=1 Tax=Streptomyces sp. NPDC006510 TaxID=3155600 RepID=UPI0033BF5B39